jgi:hypothetical protein
VFVTEEAFTGDLVTQANAVAADAGIPTDGGFGANDWLPAANAICQAAANRAGLPGTFWALLQGPNRTDIFKRLKDSDGPWALVDGTPVAKEVTALESGHLYAMIDKTEKGAERAFILQQPNLAVAWFGRTLLEMPTDHCAGWTSPGGTAQVGSYRMLHVYYRANTTRACNEALPLYCAEVGPGGAPLRFPVAPAGSKRVFVTSNAYPKDFALDAGGAGDPVHEAADALCQAEAQGKLTGTFRAWVASPALSAPAHFAANAMNGPWYRLDGFKVAGDLAALTSPEGTTAPIHVVVNGVMVDSVIAMTGAGQDGTLNVDNCSGFTTTDMNTYTRAGRVSYKDDEWAASNGVSCTQPAPLYCFEQ